jgi:hypothetical protein
MESAICDVPAEKMRSDVDEVEDARSIIRVPDHVLNMDETGFCSRPMKAKKNTIVDSMRCTTKAACRKESDVN